MRRLRRPQIPDTPRFWEEQERVLRRAVQRRARIPRLPAFSFASTTAPLGAVVAGMVALAMFTAAPGGELTGSTLPSWSQTTEYHHIVDRPFFGPQPWSVPREDRPAPTPVGEEHLIDGSFAVEELRPVEPGEPAPPDTIPQ